jgi:2-desacetyl-2-hydroxyethyl bacteriochlorophyllide A dehydrogenase
MLAMMLDEPNRFRMTAVPMPEVQTNQALVRVTSAGICASDLATIHGHSPVAAYPLIPGHECVGEVASAPADSGYAVGDLVTIFPSVGCGVCKACQEGRTNHCPTFKVMGIGLPGGCFAEFVSANVDQLVRLPRPVYDKTGPLVEPLAVGLHVNRRGAAQAGETVVIIGAGVIGLTCALVARAKGASRIALVDRFDSRRAMLARFGFESFTTASGPALVEWLAATVGPVDLIMDNVCNPQTLATGAKALRPGGRTVLVGLPHGDVTLQIPHTDAYRKELSFVVSRNYIKQDFIDTVAMLESGAIDATGMVTATFSLADMPRALEGLEGSPEAHLKVVVKP